VGNVSRPRLENRVLFATENGYIGYASEDLTTGDNAVVLYSGPTLYIYFGEMAWTIVLLVMLMSTVV
jgi:hypothetical protein